MENTYVSIDLIYIYLLIYQRFEFNLWMDLRTMKNEAEI